MKIEFVSKLNVPDFISEETLATLGFSVYEHSEPRFIPQRNDKIYTAYSCCNPHLGAFMHIDLL